MAHRIVEGSHFKTDFCWRAPVLNSSDLLAANGLAPPLVFRWIATSVGIAMIANEKKPNWPLGKLSEMRACGAALLMGRNFSKVPFKKPK